MAAFGDPVRPFIEAEPVESAFCAGAAGDENRTHPSRIA